MHFADVIFSHCPSCVERKQWQHLQTSSPASPSGNAASSREVYQLVCFWLQVVSAQPLDDVVQYLVDADGNTSKDVQNSASVFKPGWEVCCCCCLFIPLCILVATPTVCAVVPVTHVSVYCTIAHV